LTARSLTTDLRRVEALLARGRVETVEDFAALVSPAAEARLEDMARLSQRLTQQHSAASSGSLRHST
jgi:hypothetical protein